MIKSLTVTNHNRESLTLDLFHPELSGIIIESIEGLGPPEANINSNEVATMDGGIFTSARMNQRNIVLRLAMMFDPIIEDSRLRIYRFFPVKKHITLNIVTDRRNAECEGYVESNEPDIFTNHETAQISIICPDPFFYERGQEEIAFAGEHPNFEFPFSNESLDEKLIEFGIVTDDNRAVLDYRGDADTGVLITAHCVHGSSEGITIWNTGTREKIRIDTTKIKRLTNIQFGEGDDIIINTKIGEKSIRLLHDGTYYNIISCINKDADWFQITQGRNTFTFVCESGEDNLMVTFRYRNAYGGV